MSQMRTILPLQRLLTKATILGVEHMLTTTTFKVA